MANRTRLFLDDAARAAARQLALKYGYSLSEAIRRSVVAQPNAALGLPVRARQERRRARRRLIELFDGNNAADEIRRLKAQDEGF